MRRYAMAGVVLTVGTMLGVLTPAAGSTAAGATERVSRGDAEAVFEAFRRADGRLSTTRLEVWERQLTLSFGQRSGLWQMRA
jgi:hypothetical protein